MNREDLEEAFEKARTIADIIRNLARAEMAGEIRVMPSQIVFLAEELDAKFEQVQIELEDWPPAAPAPEPPPMPPRSEQEIAAEAEITEKLRRAIPMLQQRNLERAVLLAKQAAEGQGPLVQHFAELGRRFGEGVSQRPEMPLGDVDQPEEDVECSGLAIGR